MTPDDKIDPLGPYTRVRPLREGTVFAKYKVKKKPTKKEEQEEKPTTKKESTEGRIDIEA